MDKIFQRMPTCVFKITPYPVKVQPIQTVLRFLEWSSAKKLWFFESFIQNEILPAIASTVADQYNSLYE